LRYANTYGAVVVTGDKYNRIAAVWLDSTKRTPGGVRKDVARYFVLLRSPTSGVPFSSEWDLLAEHWLPCVGKRSVRARQRDESCARKGC
jgi:hypothetical protein